MGFILSLQKIDIFYLAKKKLAWFLLKRTEIDSYNVDSYNEKGGTRIYLTTIPTKLK